MINRYLKDNIEKNKTAGWIPHLVFAILAFILYSNTLNHFFVFDDEVVITKNSFTQKGIKGIPDIFKYDLYIGLLVNLYPEKTAEQFREEFKMVAGGRYRPLSLATFALEVQFFGKKNAGYNNYEFIGNPFVGHLNNILLYLFTTCLLFLILYRLFPPDKEKRWYLSFPFIVSLLFLFHPIHTEVVANIKGRDEIMTLLGSLGALWFTIKYFDTNKNYHLFLSGLCMFLGLLSKENTITFLAVIPITVYYFILPQKSSGEHTSLLQGRGVKIFISMVPLVIASLLFLLIRASVLGTTANISAEVADLMNNPFANATKGETLATIFYTLMMYVKLLFFPHPLTYDYYPFHIKIVNWLNPVAIFSFLFYLGITMYAIRELYRKVFLRRSASGELEGVVSYSIWFYLLPLTIVSNLFFPIGVFMGERFIFISSIGFSIFAGWLVYKFLPDITKNKINRNYFTGLVMIIILCLFSMKTISRNSAWKDNFTLYNTDIKVSKNSAKGNYLVGVELMKKAVFSKNENDVQRSEELRKKADKHLQRALKLHPKYPDAVESLGSLYFDCYRDIAKALQYFTTALQFNTIRRNDILNNIKVVLYSTGILLTENKVTSTPDEIIQSCKELLKLEQEFGEVYYVMGFVYGRYLNNIELALINFEKALSLDFPKTEKFYEDLGTIYGILGNYEKGRLYFLKAVEMGSNDYTIYANLGIICQKLGDVENAILYTAKSNELRNKLEK